MQNQSRRAIAKLDTRTNPWTRTEMSSASERPVFRCRVEVLELKSFWEWTGGQTLILWLQKDEIPDHGVYCIQICDIQV